MLRCLCLGAEVELLEEEAEINQGGGDPGKSGLRRRRRTLPEHLKAGKQYGQEASQQRAGNTGTG